MKILFTPLKSHTVLLYIYQILSVEKHVMQCFIDKEATRSDRVAAKLNLILIHCKAGVNYCTAWTSFCFCFFSAPNILFWCTECTPHTTPLPVTTSHSFCFCFSAPNILFGAQNVQLTLCYTNLCYNISLILMMTTKITG